MNYFKTCFNIIAFFFLLSDQAVPVLLRLLTDKFSNTNWCLIFFTVNAFHHFYYTDNFNLLLFLHKLISLSQFS